MWNLDNINKYTTQYADIKIKSITNAYLTMNFNVCASLIQFSAIQWVITMTKLTLGKNVDKTSWWTLINDVI